MKHTVRSFSVGLLTSAVILLIVFYFIEEPVQSAKDMDAEKIIPLIEAEGYTVLSKEEYIELSIGKTEKDQEETETKEASPSENNETEQEESPTEEQNSTAEKEQRKKIVQMNLQLKRKKPKRPKRLIH
ncbi:hypothetical protein [Oceanobacillus massiliensis]|uniref:hypothetical protein n=1 Tax=Oceanobacillus massiliensis TaxID=1465765 RepID=UPI0003001889|nr:hypothetical protein [Oceanobacillus massiliensis]